MEHHPQTQVAKKMSPISGPKKPLFNGSENLKKRHIFMLRRFEIQPGGFIGVHSHPEEHRDLRDKRAHYLNQWQRE